MDVKELHESDLKVQCDILKCHEDRLRKDSLGKTNNGFLEGN